MGGPGDQVALRCLGSKLVFDGHRLTVTRWWCPVLGSSGLPWPTSHRPGFTSHTAWRALIDALDAQAQVDTTPQWQAYLAELMHCAQAHLREAYEHRTPCVRDS